VPILPALLYFVSLRTAVEFAHDFSVKMQGGKVKLFLKGALIPVCFLIFIVFIYHMIILFEMDSLL